MLMKYKLLYKNGVKEEFTQEGQKEELANVHSVIYECFSSGANGIVTFGNSTSGRYVNVSDLSQFETEIIEE